METGGQVQRTAGEPRSDCGEPVIDLAVVAGDLEEVIWRFGRDFEPNDQHRMRVRDLIDETLDGDQLPNGSVDPDGAT